MKNHRLILMILLAIITAIIVVCCVIQPCIIILLGAISYVIYKIYKNGSDNNNQNSLTQQVNINGIYKIALKIFQKLADNLEIESPKKFSDIYDNNYIVYKQGLEFYRTRIRLKPSNKKDLSLLHTYLTLIQNEVYRSLACGEFDDIVTTRSCYYDLPIIVAENVNFDDLYLVVDWGILNNQEMYNYICNSKKIINIPIPSKNDEDF